MMYGEVYIGERTMQRRLRDRRCAHESRRLARRARSEEPGAATLYSRKLMGKISRVLVVAGARLVELAMPPYRATEGELMGNGSWRT